MWSARSGREQKSLAPVRSNTHIPKRRHPTASASSSGHGDHASDDTAPREKGPYPSDCRLHVEARGTVTVAGNTPESTSAHPTGGGANTEAEEEAEEEAEAEEKEEEEAEEEEANRECRGTMSSEPQVSPAANRRRLMLKLRAQTREGERGGGGGEEERWGREAAESAGGGRPRGGTSHRFARHHAPSSAAACRTHGGTR